jgi:anti-sigma factor RsiW
MQCDRAGELIGAYVDQEVDAETRREVATHLGACPACTALAEELRGISRRVAAVGRTRAPEQLTAQVHSILAAAGSDQSSARSGIQSPRFRWRDWPAQAAVLLLAFAVAAVATALLVSRGMDTGILEREIAAAHVRSLLQDSPVQIASSDTHTVKPWFAGRLEFAPNVKDFAAEGFPLAGARLDYIGERRVAALVYRRRLHVVNVFLWPSADGSSSAPYESAHRGFNIIAWSQGGIVYRAVSDLNMAELRQLQALW